MKTPVTIITGFLGSGKTTIIGGLVTYLRDQNQQVVYIKNELGSENIDAEILKGQHIETRELLNGCICCTLVGPFMSAIDELLATLNPDRIIIEASGAADPAALALMVSSHPQLLRDGVLSIIDVVNFEGYQDISISAQHQTTFTDLIIFNKVELANDEQKIRVVGYVRELNQFAPIIEAPHGHLNPQVAFGISQPELTQLLSQSATTPTHHHLTDDQLTTYTFKLESEVSLEQLQTLCQTLPKQVFRIKGLISTSDGQKRLINQVGTRFDAQPAPESMTNSLENYLVLIGFELPNVLPTIENCLKAAQITTTLATTGPVPDHSDHL